jgi:hypothetical protein
VKHAPNRLTTGFEFVGSPLEKAEAIRLYAS